MRCDAVQPAPKRRPLPEAWQALPGRQQRLLEQVLGVGQRAQDPVAVHLQFAAVRLDQLAKRRAVPGSGTREQLGGYLLILVSTSSYGPGHKCRHRSGRKAGARPPSSCSGRCLHDRDQLSRLVPGPLTGAGPMPTFVLTYRMPVGYVQADPRLWPRGQPGSTAWAMACPTAATQSPSRPSSATAERRPASGLQLRHRRGYGVSVSAGQGIPGSAARRRRRGRRRHGAQPRIALERPRLSRWRPRQPVQTTAAKETVRQATDNERKPS
jgi:hypothetical protein